MEDKQSWTVICRSLEETRSLGRVIGDSLRSGILITLQGTLGAGKTQLVQSIAQALGIDPRNVTSPTFTMIQVHPGRLALVHIDAYRIADEDQYMELGIDEYIDGDSLVAIEWGEKFRQQLPAECLEINIAVLDEFQREISFSWPANCCPEREAGLVIQKRVSSDQ